VVSNLKFDESIPGLVLAITSMILCDMMYPHGVQAANIFCKASKLSRPQKDNMVRDEGGNTMEGNGDDVMDGSDGDDKSQVKTDMTYS
jgi:hypothetical protein